MVGPNLTDDYWIHGSNFTDNVKTIWNGVPEKGMITWKNTLKPKEVYEVASYIYTLRGTHPPNPKPPENQAPVKTGPSANTSNLRQQLDSFPLSSMPIHPPAED